MKRGLSIPLTVLVLAMGAILWMLTQDVFRVDKPQSLPPVLDRAERKDRDVQPSITEDTCVAVGGIWNSCGSACRGRETDVCIELCVEYCECQADAQCPAGRTCVDRIEETGICK